MTRFIDERRSEFGVEPMCKVLPIAPATYYATKSRPPSVRELSDRELETEIRRIYDANYQVYGVRKVWKQLHREGKPVARCTVARLMRKLGLQGVIRGKTWKTTKPDTSSPRPADLVDRQFQVVAPNRLWVADLTYIRTWSGMTYAAFVMDAFSRRILGWRTSTTLRTDLALDALEMALWTDQKARSLEEPGRRGVRHPGVGGLVQPSPALRDHRPHTARGTGGRVLSWRSLG